MELSDNVQKLHPNTETETQQTSILTQPDQEFMDLITETLEALEALEAERKAINDRISAEKGKLLKHGMNKHGLKTILAYRKLNEDQQENYDITIQVMRKAINRPMQMELIEAQIDRTH